MQSFIKKVVVVAVVIAATGFAASGKAVAGDVVAYSDGYWSGGAVSKPAKNIVEKRTTSKPLLAYRGAKTDRKRFSKKFRTKKNGKKRGQNSLLRYSNEVKKRGHFRSHAKRHIPRATITLRY